MAPPAPPQVDEIERLKQEVATLQQEIDELQRELRFANASLAECEKARNDLSATIETQSARLAECEKTRKDLSATIETQSARLAECEKARNVLSATIETQSAKLAECEKARRDLSATIVTQSAKLEEAQSAKHRAEAANEELNRQIGKQEVDLKASREALEQTHVVIENQMEELGRLRVISEMAEAIRAERDKCARELAQLKTDLELRITEEVKAALERSKMEHDQAAAQWAKERDKYLAEIEALKANLNQIGAKSYVFPTDLATKFAQVIEMQAASQPAPGSQYSAALTSMEVEARGILESPRENEDQPRFVTVESGKVDPATLSTLRMTFKILPHLAAPEE